jgi:hypothetical protein
MRRHSHNSKENTKMVNTQAQVGDTTIEIDTSALEKRILEDTKKEFRPIVEKWLAEVKEKREGESSKNGKGIVESYIAPDKKTKLVEEFKKGGNADPQVIKEQWTITLPKSRAYEIAAHLRDLVYVDDRVIKGVPGDTVNVPYVKDVDFASTTVGTGSFSATTGLVSTLTGTLVEAGAYYDAYYSDIEKIDGNLLDEINNVFAHAAVRSEDAQLIALMEQGTTHDFDPINTSRKRISIEAGNWTLAAGSTMQITWISDAIAMMIAKGKDLHPGELALILPPQMYITLLKRLSAVTNTAVAYAIPSIWTQGLVESYLGVKIIVSGREIRSKHGTGIGGGGTSYECAFLFRPKRALGLAPKRDLLIETDKIVASRTLRIVATHTFAPIKIDLSEAVRIWSAVAATST